MEILHFEYLGIRVSFGGEHSCSSHRRLSHFNSKVPQGGIYPHIKFVRDRLNTFRVRVFTSSGSDTAADAAAMLKPVYHIWAPMLNNVRFWLFRGGGRGLYI